MNMFETYGNPIGYQSVTASSTATLITASLKFPTNRADFALVTVRKPIRFTLDGTTAATLTGHLMTATDGPLLIKGVVSVSQFQFALRKKTTDPRVDITTFNYF